MTAKEEFLAWFASEKEKGLIDFHLEVDPNRIHNPNLTEEDLYAEIMGMLKAKDMPDEEVLGKYTFHPCPFCGKKIRIGDDSCSHCKVEFGPDQWRTII